MSNEKRMRLLEDLIREMREFIAGAILNNQRIADRLGINYTDQQVLNLVDLLQDANTRRPRAIDRPDHRRGDAGARPPGKSGFRAAGEKSARTGAASLFAWRRSVGARLSRSTKPPIKSWRKFSRLMEKRIWP